MSLSMRGSFKFMPEGGGMQYSLVIQDILWNHKYFMIIMEEVYLDWDPIMVLVNIPLNSSPFTTADVCVDSGTNLNPFQVHPSQAHY